MQRNGSRRGSDVSRRALAPPSINRGGIVLGIVGAIAVLAVVLILALSRNTGSAGQAGQSGLTAPSDLAPAPDYAGHPSIDGIPCGATEVVTYHVHAHLAIFVDGQERSVPPGIGIAPPRQLQTDGGQPFVTGGACFYYLHTHARDGIVHVEAPGPQPFTLGQFMDVWKQPLSSNAAGPASGSVIAYVGGQPFQGDVRSIPLAAHAAIQLDVNQDVAPRPYEFPAGL